MSPGNTHTCTPVQAGVKFCYPDENGGPFFIAIDPGISKGELGDRKIIVDRFKKLLKWPASRVSKGPEGVPAHWRTYNVTQNIPGYIQKWLWRQMPNHGPNCYQAALCSAGFDYLCGRYVDGSEVEFILSMFYEPAPDEACRNQFGSLAVYTERLGFGLAEMNDDTAQFAPHHAPISADKGHSLIFGLFSYVAQKAKQHLPYFDSGTHISFTLMGEHIFHKLSPDAGDGHKINHINEVGHELDETAIAQMIRNREEAGEIHSYREKKHAYYYDCYRPKAKTAPPKGRIGWQVEERNKYIKLFDYYSQMILNVAKAGNGAGRFEKHRLSLITIENLWKILSDFRDKIGSQPRASLSQDWELAKAYFTAYSLSWQYQYMSDRFYQLKPLSADSQLKELYSKHYLKTSDPRLIKEIHFYLHLKKVPQKHWIKITRAVLAELLRREDELKSDPDLYRRFYNSNGGVKIDYFEALQKAIAHFM